MRLQDELHSIWRARVTRFVQSLMSFSLPCELNAYAPQVFEICASPTTAAADITMRARFTIDGNEIDRQVHVIGNRHVTRNRHPRCDATYSEIDGVTHRNPLKFHLPVCCSSAMTPKT